MPIKIWGLTGFAGSGKSSAMEYLSNEGYPTCDSDDLAYEILDHTTAEGQANLIELKNLLGAKALIDDTMPNRQYLRQIIFENSVERKNFEGWIFPKIIAKFEVIKKEWEDGENLIGFIEGTRLVESGYVSSLEGLILVTAVSAVRKKRLVEKRGMTEAEVDALLAAQDPKVAERQADFRWDNSTTLLELHKQIEVFLMVSDPNS